MSPSVDIVVVTYNSREQILGCLDSIQRSAFDGTVRTVVVDNRSTDDTVALLMACHPAVELIVNAANRGFAAACNQGIRAAPGEFILLLNPDAQLLPSTLARLVSYLCGHPAVGIVGPALRSSSGTLQRDISATGLFPSFPQALFEYTRLSRLYPESHWYRDYFLTDWDRETSRPVAMVQGACFLFRRALLDDIGDFDERFFLYFEETDFCKRATNVGWEVHYVGDAAAIHLGGRSMAGRRQSARHFIASLYVFHRKHYGILEAAALWGILMPYHCLRALRLGATVPFKPHDRQLRADLRTAVERFVAHWQLMVAWGTMSLGTHTAVSHAP
ncbi:MAG: glycosyltransferase family 2 protein [Candidatus Binatia bacterium]